jgi:Domain of Unknown Function with PDB structure (DUF3857)
MLGAPRTGAGDDWPPVSQEELKMTSEPQAPGAPAIYLFRKVDRDDQNAHEDNYARIKILTDEGRKYGNVELPFIKGQQNVRGIKARTIRPDGTVVNFDGKVYEQTVIKAKGLKFLAKTFTMPEVQVGSILEYRYVYDWEGYIFIDSRWILSEELFTKHASFSLKPYQRYALRWSWPTGLPAGTAPPKDEHGTIHLDSQNIPAFQFEDYMPPENELKFRVDFVYLPAEDSPEKDPDKFWKREGKKLYDRVEAFAGKRKAMEQAVTQIVEPNDPPEVKLQKIYARVQQVRNSSFEERKTEQEQKREKLKEPGNVEEMWKNGYGSGRNITWLFLALVRAAGFEAYPVLVSRRSDYFFNRGTMNPNQLNDNVVLVKLNGLDLYLDPGTAHTPFGLLPWPETYVQGLRLDKDGGSWLRTTLPSSSESQIERKAVLKLNQNSGSLEGKLTVTFSGLEALDKRIGQRNQDDASRKKFLEDQIKEYIPTGIEVELTNKPDWNSSSPTLVAEYDLKVPGWIAGAGRRALLPIGLFSNTEKHVFEHANRIHPIYFDFPFEKTDDITIELPPGWKVSSLPAGQNEGGKFIGYSSKAEEKNGTLHLTRKIRLGLVFVEQKNYPALRGYFQMVKTGDEQQIVLQPGS